MYRLLLLILLCSFITQIQASVENPECNVTIVNATTNQLNLTCQFRTSHYPLPGRCVPVPCLFCYSKENNVTFHELLGKTSAANVNDNVTQCNLTMTVLGTYSRLYFKVFNGTPSNENCASSGKMLTFDNPEIPLETPPTTLPVGPANIQQDEASVTTLAVFLVLVVGVAVGFAIMWYRARDKLQMPKSIELPAAGAATRPAVPVWDDSLIYDEKLQPGDDAEQSYLTMSFEAKQDNPPSSEATGNNAAGDGQTVAGIENSTTPSEDHVYGNVSTYCTAQEVAPLKQQSKKKPRRN